MLSAPGYAHFAKQKSFFCFFWSQKYFGYYIFYVTHFM